jgi:hypothetical protein
MLGEDDNQNPRDVAKKADSLWALHRMHAAPGAAEADVDGPFSVDGLSSSPSFASAGASRVAEVSSRSTGCGGRGLSRGGHGSRGGRAPGVSRGGEQP